MERLSPNLKYDHVFAIVRVDTFGEIEVKPETMVTVKKIAWSQRDAEAEVARLNRLNKDKGCVYFWQITRLERKRAQERAAQSAPSVESTDAPVVQQRS